MSDEPKPYHKAVTDGWKQVKSIVDGQHAADTPLGDKHIQEHISGEIEKAIERSDNVAKRVFPRT